MFLIQALTAADFSLFDDLYVSRRLHKLLLPASGDSFSYDLYAVADHHGGGSEEGHYTASALQHVTGDW